MSNFVIIRPGKVTIVPAGALENDVNAHDLGSVRAVDFSYQQTAEEATDAALGDAVVDVGLFQTKGSLKMTLEEMTAQNFAFTLNSVVSGSSVINDAPIGTPSYYSIYVHGPKIAGVPSFLHVMKAYIKPNGGIKMEKTQMLLDVEFVCMGDPSAATGAKFFRFDPETAYTNAVALLTTANKVVPNNNATGAVTSVVWTFQQTTGFGPILGDDVTASNFFVFTDSTGAPIPGALTFDGGGVVTFTPTSAFTGGGTAYRAVAEAGVRDVSRTNPLATSFISKFTVS